MVLVDEGNGKDLEFGHTDYYTGEGRPVTHSENQKERHVNPELSYEERAQITIRDNKRRNRYQICLLSERNTCILEDVSYNPFTEALSLSWSVTGNHGKQLLDVSEPGTEKWQEYLKRDQYQIYLFGKNNIRISEFVSYDPFTENLSYSWQVKAHHGKKIFNITKA